MKKLLLLFMAIVLLPLAAWADDGPTITYTVLTDSTCMVGDADNAAIDQSYSGEVVIPEEYEGRRVVAISSDAFIVCRGLTSVIIPESVTSIGYSAFNNCSGLTNVIIPESVTSIAPYAFQRCYNLTSIKIPKSVTSIGACVFGGCGLTSITVESGNPKYDSRGDCNAIIETESNTLIAGCESTVIPESVKTIGDYAFDMCSGLTSITIPDGVTSIGDYAFYVCSGLTSIKCEIVSPFDIEDDTFPNETYASAHLYVPAGTKAAYQATDGWKKFTHIVEMDDDVQSIEAIERDETSVVSHDIMGRRIDQRSIPAGQPYVVGGRIRVKSEK